MYLTRSNKNIVLTTKDLRPYKQRTDGYTLRVQDFNISYDVVQKADSVTFIDNDGQFITFKRK